MIPVKVSSRLWNVKMQRRGQAATRYLQELERGRRSCRSSESYKSFTLKLCILRVVQI